MKIFIICTVRDATEEYRDMLESYTEQLESAGHEVHLPHRDTNQDQDGIGICGQNNKAIKEADEVHIFYNPKSTGTHFDLGMTFALNKKLVVVGNVEYDDTVKSFARMIDRLHSKTVDVVEYRIEGKIYNTDIKKKADNFDAFVELLKNQFIHGGEKYALENQPKKESTDWVCELVPGETGVDWILGTAAKYIARFKNFGREKDLLKIATYMYIIWLKMGFYLTKEHDEGIGQGEQT